MRVATLKQQQRKDRQRQRAKKQRAAQLQRLDERAAKYEGVEDDAVGSASGDTSTDSESTEDTARPEIHREPGPLVPDDECEVAGCHDPTRDEGSRPDALEGVAADAKDETTPKEAEAVDFQYDSSRRFQNFPANMFSKLEPLDSCHDRTPEVRVLLDTEGITGPQETSGDMPAPGPARPLSAVLEESDSARSDSPPSVTSTPSTEAADLQQRLEAANAEIARLHEVIRHQKGNVISITYPMPSVNGAALLEPAKFEYMKEVFSGLILELIRTTHAGLEKENRKAFSFYTVQEREVTMHFAETEGL